MIVKQISTLKEQILIDHTYGCWYTLLNEEYKRYQQEKSTAPKADYHPVAAFHKAMLSLES